MDPISNSQGNTSEIINHNHMLEDVGNYLINTTNNVGEEYAQYAYNFNHLD